MIHEIEPRKFCVDYVSHFPAPDDTVFVFDGDAVFCRLEDGNLILPSYGELDIAGGANFRYLFSIDSEKFFSPDVRSIGPVFAPEGYELHEISIFRVSKPLYKAFAVVTAHALYEWYEQSRFCGRCGAETAHSPAERSCLCPKCGLVVYPRISPVVIVGVTHGDYLLVTRYKNRPQRSFALVAGFAEIGEAFEDTVRREVFEETGVRVKNIRYYKSQPWGFTSTLLSGFFCELDGDPTINVDENELAEAVWRHRDDIPPADNNIALTAEMIEVFRRAQHYDYSSGARCS